jgi:hypothetical protein
MTSQVEVKAAIARVQAKYPAADIASHVNVAVATCTPVFVDTDIPANPRYPGEPRRTCRANNNTIDAPGQMDTKINFITPKQDKDLSRDSRTQDLLSDQIPKLFHVAAYLNNEGVIHGDAHFGNIAWIGDRLVLHDWGRAFIGVEGFKKFIAEYDLTTVRGQSMAKTYGQYRKPCEMLDACPAMADDNSTHRFMKMFDVLSILGSAEDKGYITGERSTKFSKQLKTLWHNVAVPTENMMDEIHKYIDELFLGGIAPIGYAGHLVGRVVPVAEITPTPGPPVPREISEFLQRLEDEGKGVRLSLRQAGQSQGPFQATIDVGYMGVVSPWIYFVPDEAGTATVTQLGYKTIPDGTHHTVKPPMIVLEETYNPAKKRLYVPIDPTGTMYKMEEGPVRRALSPTVQVIGLVNHLKAAGTRVVVMFHRAGQPDASITADIGGAERPWIHLKLTPETTATVTGLGYETVPENGRLAINPPRIILEATADPAVKGLFLPILEVGATFDMDVAPTAGGRRKDRALTRRFCSCIKKVRKTVKNEKGPIAICVKSVLQKKGRTLKRFTCGKKGRVITQKARR